MNDSLSLFSFPFCSNRTHNLEANTITDSGSDGFDIKTNKNNKNRCGEINLRNSPSSPSRKGTPLISDTTKKSVIKKLIIMFIKVELRLICSAVELVLLCYSRFLTVRFTELVNPIKARKKYNTFIHPSVVLM